jgi:hypothetical protein
MCQAIYLPKTKIFFLRQKKRGLSGKAAKRQRSWASGHFTPKNKKNHFRKKSEDVIRAGKKCVKHGDTYEIREDGAGGEP